MRITVRSLRQFRHVFQRQSCVMINNLVAEKPCFFEKCCQIHSSSYRVIIDQPESDLIKNHAFITTSSRSVSTDAVKLTNEGFPWFLFFFFGQMKGFKVLFLIWFVFEFVAEINRRGPLIEYERRIANGELVDGDSCQVEYLHSIDA